MMMDLTGELGGTQAAPFQYIVTTTSTPPPEVHEAIGLHLRGHPQSEMLFKRVLRNPDSEESPDLLAGAAERDDLGTG